MKNFAFKMLAHIFAGSVLFVSVAEAEVITLPQALEEAVRENPEVRAAHERVHVARARIPQVKGLDDPLIGIGVSKVPIDTLDPGRSDEIEYMIQQTLPFPGKRHTLGKVERLNAEVVAGRTQADIADVLLDVKRTYYDLYRLERQLEVNRETQTLFGQFLVSAEAAYSANHVASEIPLRIGVELTEIKNTERILEQEKNTHLAHFKALLHRSSGADIVVSPKVKLPKLEETLEETRTLAVKMRPEIRQVEAMEKRDLSRVTAAKQAFIPDLEVRLSYQQRPEGRQDAWSGRTMINLPVFWTRKKGVVDEAKSALRGTQAEVQSLKNHTHHEVEQLYGMFRTEEGLLRSYRMELLPRTKTMLESARAAYAAGQAGLLTLVEVTRTHQNLKMSFHEQEARVGIRFSELERLVARDLSGKI